MKAAVCIAVVTFLLGVYLTVPVLLFDCNQAVVVLERPDIDELASLDKDFRAYFNPGSGTPRSEEAEQKLAAIRDKWNGIVAGGGPGYSLVSQEVFLGQFQTPHFVRGLFAWIRHIPATIALSPDEYLGWSWFTLICVNVAYHAHQRVRKRWKDSQTVIASSRWLLFCASAMAASMILMGLLECGFRVAFTITASRVFSGPAYVLDQYGCRIPWIWEERMILYSAIQWLLIGGLGCLLMRKLEGRHLLLIVVAVSAVCAVMGLGVADAVP